MCYVCTCAVFFFFKQKTAYEMRISDWSSDVCSSDLLPGSTVNVLSIDGGIVLDGYVGTATESADAQLLATRFVAEGETVINRLRVTEQIGRASCRERVCQYV